MKTIYSFNFPCMFLILSFFLFGEIMAQKGSNAPPDQNCEIFDNGIGTWQRSNVLGSINTIFNPTNTTPGPSGAPGDLALDGFDSSGSDILFNQVDYRGDLRKKGDCFCYDFLVINNQQTQTSQPRVTFYIGDMTTMPRTYVLWATFTFNQAIDENDGWVRICIPIGPTQNGNLPTSPEGVWTMPAGQTAADFDTIMTSASGLYFNLDLNSSPVERYAVDNICFDDCPISDEPTNEGAFCCDESENLIQNGNFEFGNTGFNSQYTQSSSTLPGQYDVTNSAANFGANITDHSYCVDPTAYANNDQYLLVNGLTNQPNGSSSIIYSQNLPLEKEKEYKFCINFKNMPQCTFDIIPEVQIEVNGQIVIPYTQINTDSTDPCDWMLLSGCFIGSGGKNQIRIRLKEDGLGDGNDLAIDDISVQEKIDPDYNLTVTHDGGNNTISATVNPFPFMNEACESDYNYAWFVYETTNPTSPLFGSVVPGTFAWSDSSGSYGAVSSGTPWATPTTNFPNYTSFQNNKFYVVGMYVPSCCESCYTDGWTYQITYNWSNRGIQQFEMSNELKEEIKSLFVKTKIQNQEQPISELIQIYPNPNQGFFQMKTQNITDGKLEIFDLNRKPVYAENFSNKSNFQFNISNQPKGIYVMKLTSADNRTFTENIILK